MKFSAKKSIFLNCPIKRARRASRKGNFEKSIFWPKISLKNLKNDQIEVVGPKFLNALYYHHESRVCRSGIHDGVFRDRQGGKIRVCGGAEPNEDFKKLYSNGILSYDKRIMMVDRPMPMFYFHKNRNSQICQNIISVLGASTVWSSSSVHNSQDASIAAPNRFSGWSPLKNDTTAWIQVELDKPKVIKELRLQGFKTSVAHMAYVNKFRLKIRNSSKTGNSWRWFTPDRGIVFKDYKMDFIEVNEMRDVEVRFTFYTAPVFQSIKIFVGSMRKIVNNFNTDFWAFAALPLKHFVDLVLTIF